MYSPQVLDHFEHPRNAGTVADADALARIENPACGDVLELTVKAAGGRIAEIRFKAKGCVAAMACGSAVTELVGRMTVADARKLTREELVRRRRAASSVDTRKPPGDRHAGGGVDKDFRLDSARCRRSFYGERSIIFWRVEAGLFERVRNGDVGDALGVRVQDLARVARGRRIKKMRNQFAADQKWVPVFAIVLRDDSPDALREGALERSAETLERAGS